MHFGDLQKKTDSKNFSSLRRYGPVEYLMCTCTRGSDVSFREITKRLIMYVRRRDATAFLLYGWFTGFLRKQKFGLGLPRNRRCPSSRGHETEDDLETDNVPEIKVRSETEAVVETKVVSEIEVIFEREVVSETNRLKRSCSLKRGCP
jgi:hypothetical protein